MDTQKHYYHYTKSCALKEILRSNKLRLTSCNQYKDANSEAEYIKLMIRSNISDPAFKAALEEYVEKYANKCETEDELINTIASIRENTWMVCFSDKHNNKHLLRKYAPKSEGGVVIEFDAQYIGYTGVPITNAREGECSNGEECNRGRVNEYIFQDMRYGCKNKFKQSVLDWKTADPIFLHFILDSFKDKKYEKEEESRLLVFCSASSGKECKIRIEKIPPNIMRKFKKEEFFYFELVSFTKDYITDGTTWDKSHAIKRIYFRDTETMDSIKQYIASLVQDSGCSAPDEISKIELELLPNS